MIEVISVKPVDLEPPTPRPSSLPMLWLSHPFITGLSAHVYLHTGMNGFSAANCCWLFSWRLVLCFSNQSSGILRGAVCFFRYGSIIYIVSETLQSSVPTVCWMSDVRFGGCLLTCSDEAVSAAFLLLTVLQDPGVSDWMRAAVCS